MADCWYSLISPASLGRGWIRSDGDGEGQHGRVVAPDWVLTVVSLLPSECG